MSSSAALVRLGFPTLPPASAKPAADACLRSFHLTFHNAVLKIQGSLICNTPHLRPPIRSGGYSMSRAGPSAPPLEHQYKALVPISTHRTISPTAPKGSHDSWQGHLFFAKENVYHPDFQGRSNVHVTEDFIACKRQSHYRASNGARCSQAMSHEQLRVSKYPSPQCALAWMTCNTHIDRSPFQTRDEVSLASGILTSAASSTTKCGGTRSALRPQYQISPASPSLFAQSLGAYSPLPYAHTSTIT